MLAVRRAAHFLVMSRTTVAGVDDEGYAGLGSQSLLAVEQMLIQWQAAAAAAFELFNS